MQARRQSGSGRERLRGQAGFTLVELLITVAIIGLLASIAIPSLRNALRKSQRNAATSDMRVLRDSLMRYAADNGRYPLFTGFNIATLSPLDTSYLQRPDKVLQRLTNRRLDLYLPWNVFNAPLDPLEFANAPQSFLIIASLREDPTTKIYVTDDVMYYLVGTKLIPIGDN